MAQTKVNGQVQSGQFVVGSLTHFTINANGSANVSNVGYNAGVANPGEELVTLVGTVCNPVLWRAVSANVVHFAAEVAGHSAASIAAVINASPTFTGVTVTEGQYTVA